MPVQTPFTQWLEQKYLEWQSARKRRGSLREFARYLGIRQGREGLVSSWISGFRRPGGEYVERLAIALGVEVYEVLNLPRPNEKLLRVKQLWNDLTEEQQAAYAEKIERTTAGRKKIV